MHNILIEWVAILATLVLFQEFVDPAIVSRVVILIPLSWVSIRIFEWVLAALYKPPRYKQLETHYAQVH